MEDPEGKNVVLCYDGTGNEYGPHNTNVVRIFEALQQNARQVAFYDPGVGTVGALGRRVGKKVGTWLGKAFGYGLRQNLEDGYAYLMRRFQPGDRLFLFGFSRGAFTARALAGMLHRFGVLREDSRNLIPYVSKHYLSGNFAAAEGFCDAFCRPCAPHFIGVWDTVASLGHFYGRQFFDARLGPHVRYAYQAVAIDEQRKKFPVSLWDEQRAREGQTIEQVWFPGVHSDVGGWYEERALSDIAFAWMMDRAAACGLRLKQDWPAMIGQDAAGTLHASRVGLWRLWRPVQRTIPEGSLLHQSVLDRREVVPGYQPPLPENWTVVSNPSYTPPAQGAHEKSARLPSSQGARVRS